MKKLLIILFSVGIALGASAQKIVSGHRGGGGVHYVTRPRVSIGIGAFAPPFYGGYYGNPYYSPFYQPYYHNRPTKLDLQIEDIKNDYNQKIWAANHDDHLSRKERKKQVHELKSERDREITSAKRNYYKY